MLNRLRLLYIVISVCWGTAVAAGAPALEDFYRRPLYGDAALSPDGSTVAMHIADPDHPRILFIRLPKQEVIGHYETPGTLEAGSLTWLGNRRIAAVTSYRDHDVMFAVDADGSAPTLLTGGSESGPPVRMTIIDPLPDDPRHALVQRKHDAREIFKVDVYGNRYELVGDGPPWDMSKVFVDRDGQVLFAQSYDENRVRYYTRPSPGAKWRRLDFTDHKLAPHGFLQASPQGGHILMRHQGPAGRACLAALGTNANAKPELLACDERADIHGVVMSSDGTTPIAALVLADYPRYHYLQEEHPEARRLRLLERSFAQSGLFAVPASSAEIGERLLLWAWSDRHPGAYFVHDPERQRIELLYAVRDWIDPGRMAPRKVVRVKVRDGLELPAILTLPEGSGPSSPVVVMPHGGPITVQDTWSWDADAQMLASRGYVVVQPNFRGSGGYGVDYLKAGAHQYGGQMIDDIVDVTRWALQTGHGDPSRICIAGASYGGFAALWGAIREPELFRCVITTAGLYDLRGEMRHIFAQRYGLYRTFVSEFIGGRGVQKAQSPSGRLAALRAPVLVLHGTADDTVPIRHAERLVSDLQQLGRPFEMHFYEGEGHGGWSVANDVDRAERMLQFLARHLADRSAQAAGPDAAQSSR